MALPSIKRLPLVTHGASLRIDPDWQARLSALGILDPRQPRAPIAGEQLSGSPATQCFRIALPDGETVYFKRYVYTQRRPPNYWLLPSKACNEVWGLQQLARLGIPTIEVLALGEYRRFGSLICGFLVTRGLSDARDLRDVLASTGRQGWARLRPLADRLIDQVRHAHDNGFFHHDLSVRNILLRGEAGEATSVWIDCPRASNMHLRNWRGRVVDLWCLAHDVRDRLSVYAQYRLLRRYAMDFDRKARSRLFRDLQRRFAQRKSRRQSRV